MAGIFELDLPTSCGYFGFRLGHHVVSHRHVAVHVCDVMQTACRRGSGVKFDVGRQGFKVVV